MTTKLADFTEQIRYFVAKPDKTMNLLNMQAQLLDAAGQPVPRFASFLATRIPRGFLAAARALIESACEQGYDSAPAGHDVELSYWKNIQPHNRNSLVFERLHRLAEEMNMNVRALELDNGYQYLEIESNGLLLHIKHENNYQSLTEQITKAEYRRQLITLNADFTQLSLRLDEWPVKAPDRAYAILFYTDGRNKSSVGNIFFVLPDSQNIANLARCSIEEVLGARDTTEGEDTMPANDSIPLPPKFPLGGAGLAAQ